MIAASKLNLAIYLSVALIGLSGTSEAALVFSINGQTGSVVGPTLTTGSPSTNLTIAVSRSDADSGGTHLGRFAFRLRLSDPSVASFTNVSLSTPGVLSGASTSIDATTATAQANYTTRPLVFSSFVNLATFTLTGMAPGSFSVTIEELTVDSLSGGPIDFLLGESTGGTLVGQDRIGFSGPGNVIGTATTQGSFSSTIVGVPEPASCLLVGGALVGMGLRRWRRKP